LLAIEGDTQGGVWALPLDGKAKAQSLRDEVQRAERPVFAGWALGRVLVERVGHRRSVRSAVSFTRG